MLRSYLSPSPSSDKMRSKRRSGITSTNSLHQNPSNRQNRQNATVTANMGIVDYEEQQHHRPSSGLDGSTAAATEPPPGCDRDSLWWALVMVASQRYEEMVKEEEEAAASKVAEQQQPQQVEEPLSLVVQERVQEVLEDGDGDDRLVIDEAGPSTAIAAPPTAATTAANSDAKRKPVPEDTAGTSSNGGNYQVPVRYNANMARKFPGAENRTPEQQAVRQRNTVAARQSRAKMRIMEEMLTHEAGDERTINEYMKERIAACFTYGNALRDILQMDEADFWAEFQAVKDEYIAEPLRSQHVVPRTISDGSCSDYQDYSDDEEGGEEEEEGDQQQPGTSADTAGNRRG